MAEKARESLFATLLLSTICASYSLYIDDHGNFDHEIVKRQVNPILETPHVTNWGDWGNWAHCPSGSFVVGMQLKTESSQGSGDDTALNAIRLVCSSPDYAINLYSITPSPEGPWGTWGSFYNCRNSAAIGFEIRSERSQGGGSNDDDTATNNMRLICSNNQVLEGDGKGWGSWTGERRCLDGYYLCGIQTQVEPRLKDGDDTALNNVRMICCEKPRPVNPATTCTPFDIWQAVLECDNTAGRTSTPCTLAQLTGVSDMQSQSSTTRQSQTYTETTEWGIITRVGFEFDRISASLKARFGELVGKSRTTGYDWTQASSTVFSQEKTTITSKQVAPGEKLILQQVVGTCGRFRVKTDTFRIIAERINPPTTVNPATTCTPTDTWKTVLECDNTASRTSTQCPAQLKTGVSDAQSQSSNTSQSQAFTETTERGITTSVGFEFGPISDSLKARFGESVGKSRTTGYDWTQASSTVFSQEKTTITSKQVAPGEKLIIQQVVGTCGRFSVNTNKFKIIDERMQ